MLVAYLGAFEGRCAAGSVWILGSLERRAAAFSVRENPREAFRISYRGIRVANKAQGRPAPSEVKVDDFSDEDAQNAEDQESEDTQFADEDIVGDAAVNRAPNKICNYLQKLAQYVHSFYTTSKVLTAESEELKNQRVNLLAACEITLKNGLNLIGVSAPEKM